MNLHPSAFRPLPLGHIRPLGWLARQLRIQADSISGHLDEFWPDVRDSRWLGGTAEGWERVPYWLDGVIPLAFVLDDAALKAKVTRHVDYILDSQAEDGWLGPRTMVAYAGAQESPRYDLWAQFLILKALVQYHEATGDERVPLAVENCLRQIDRHIDRAPLFNWGQFRWFESLIAIYWLYERTGEGWLLDLAVKLQAQGFHWGEFFRRWPLTGPTPKGRWNFMGHVVNNAMAPKAHGLWWRLTGEEADREAAYDVLAKLDEHHGMVTGVFTGDECIAGHRPTQGTELCAVVELAYSLEVLLSVFGDPAFGDRLEKIIFNALPATFSPDMWAHQYDQQVNQVECSVRERGWNTNGPESNIFGVEPNYGCCTANLSQGWPKFAAHLWMQDDGPSTGSGQALAAIAYAPSRAHCEIEGVPVTVTLETGYPFRDILRFTVETEQPVVFPLHLRIPAWAAEPTIHPSTGSELALNAVKGQAPAGVEERIYHPGFYSIYREWRGTTEIVLRLPMRPSLWRGLRDTVAIQRGPLVYALKIGEEWRRIHADLPYRELPHADWEVHPTTPWNYALAVSEETLATDVTFAERPIEDPRLETGECLFSPEGAPVTATVKGRRVPGWGMANGSAADAPASPVRSTEPLEELTLIPYGCTNLRITEFPVLSG